VRALTGRTLRVLWPAVTAAAAAAALGGHAEVACGLAAGAMMGAAKMLLTRRGLEKFSRKPNAPYAVKWRLISYALTLVGLTAVGATLGVAAVLAAAGVLLFANWLLVGLALVEARRRMGEEGGHAG